jgi:aminomethyltransferase
MKTTSLHDYHLQLNAKMVDFGGFDMPLYYSNITNEHFAVRQKSGIFDVSHMGEILILGKDAIVFVNHIVSNSIDVNQKKVTYALLCNYDGHVIDDLLVYVIDVDKVLLVVNASNIEKDYAWIMRQKKDEDVNIRNVSDDYSQIAIQGPLAHTKSVELLDLLPYPLSFMEYAVVPYLNDHVIVSRTGYTGEDGYEIYGKHELIKMLWEKALEAGITPCGLGARDTLRFEATLPLYGHELNETLNPLEAGLSFAVKNTPFIGSDAIQKAKVRLTKKLVGIQMNEKGIPRAEYTLHKGDTEIGYITTGYLLPTQSIGLALGYVTIDEAYLGNQITVDIRGKKLSCTIVKKTFMKKNYKKGDE